MAARTAAAPSSSSCRPFGSRARTSSSSSSTPRRSPHAGQPAPATRGPATQPARRRACPARRSTFTLAMDASDMIADGARTGGIAERARALHPRLAALEMLLFPRADGGGLLGDERRPGASAGAAASRQRRPAAQLPTVLFVWGPGRICRCASPADHHREAVRRAAQPDPRRGAVGLRVLTPKS